MSRLLLVPELTGSNCFKQYTQFSVVLCKMVNVSKQALVKDKVYIQQQYCLKILFFFSFPPPLMLISGLVYHSINNISITVGRVILWKESGQHTGRK